MKNNTKHNHSRPVRVLSVKERKIINAVCSGKGNINSKRTQTILDRPHVAVFFQTLLENSGLDDKALVERLRDIIERKPTESISHRTGAVTTNITSIDSNARETIRMIWQVQGKFNETKAPVDGGLGQIGDEQLDILIKQGMQIIVSKGKVPLDNTSSGTSSDTSGSTANSTDSGTLGGTSEGARTNTADNTTDNTNAT